MERRWPNLRELYRWFQEKPYRTNYCTRWAQNKFLPLNSWRKHHRLTRLQSLNLCSCQNMTVMKAFYRPRFENWRNGQKSMWNRSRRWWSKDLFTAFVRCQSPLQRMANIPDSRTRRFTNCNPGNRWSIIPWHDVVQYFPQYPVWSLYDPPTLKTIFVAKTEASKFSAIFSSIAKRL